MKITKRIGALALALALALSALGGCGKKDAPATAEKSTIPRARDTRYPAPIPINMEDSFQIPFP